MKSHNVIEVEALSKQYWIGEQRAGYQTLRDVISDVLRFRAKRNRKELNDDTANADDRNNGNRIWALRDISFEVKQGDVLGIIGRNGAGKSTLLKILSRITEPSSGYVNVRGRVGSLLEVGTGFHQELTGRENVYLSGAILGMSRSEINRKFDEIVAFAGVEKFMDMPVKRYSSGMHLRLAFSVAAHLEPEILLVDEILAVGDIAFQQKCLGKMNEVAADGRTVLFVSHSLGVVKELCQSSLVLNDGRVQFRGPVVEGLIRYTQNTAKHDIHSHASGGAGWSGVRINGSPDGMPASISSRSEFFVESWLDLNEDLSRAHLFLILNDSVGNTVLHQRVASDEISEGPLQAGRYRVRVDLPSLWLAPGIYTIHFKLIGHGVSLRDPRFFSERVTLDVIGSASSIAKAYLSPPASWRLMRQEESVRQRA